MKNLFFIFLFSALFVSQLFTQSCLPNGIVFTRQSQVDSFPVNYPGCTQLAGNMTISGPDILSLDSLTQLTAVDSTLRIDNCTRLSSLRGLDNLSGIGQSLIISKSHSLTSMRGLDQLSFVGRDVQIRDNRGLQTLKGLDRLRSIDFNLILSKNPRLITLNGLQNLLRIGGDLMVFKHKILPSFERLASLNEIGGSVRIRENEGLFSLQGLDKIEEIPDHLILYDNAILDVAGLRSLRFIGGYLEIRDNRDLTSLDGFKILLSVEGDVLIINNDRLKDLLGLDLLTVIKRDLIIQENDLLSSLVGLNEIYDIFGNCRILYNDQLSDLTGLNKLLSIGGNLDIRGNDKLSNLDGLELLSAIEGDLVLKYNALLKQVDALSDLASIWGGLEIEWNNILSSIEGLANIDYNTITRLIIQHNRTLSVCHVESVCKYLQFKTPSNILDNDTGCNSIQEVLGHCLNNVITGTVFFDFNQNKIQDASERGIPNIPVTINPGNITLLTNGQGIYSFYRGQVDSTYTLEVNTNPDWVLTTDSASYKITFIPGDPTLQNNDFGLFPTNVSHNVSVVTTSKRTRCNFVIPFYTTLQNEGAFIEKGQFTLRYDPEMIYVSSATQPDIIDTVNHSLTWLFDSLYPFETIEIINEFKMPGVQNLGKTIEVETSVFLDNNGQLELHDTHQYQSVIVCSYDPNDKAVNPVGKNEERFILKSETLYYTIRFQNTGNIEAIDVRLEDQLSEYLDWSSLKLIQSSHPVQTYIDADGKVEFLFKDIYLPDSGTDYDGSQGYVLYEIKPKSDISSFVLVDNTAYIYFDLNPPIITNTTSNTIVDKYPFTTHVVEGNELNEMSVYPNPAFRELRIQHPENLIITNAYITDNLGNITPLQSNNQGVYDIESLAAGMYILAVEWENDTIKFARIIIAK